MSSTAGNSVAGDKAEPIHVTSSVGPHDKPQDTGGKQGVDVAWKFLDANRGQEHESVDIVKLRHKIDWRIVPLMFAAYTMQFLDKVILNYAAVMGMPQELKLQGNDFSNIATFLFVGLLAFEIPNIYFLQAVPAAKWLGFNVVAWGVATACGAAAHNYQTLLVSRVFLGIFEATIGPSLMLIVSQYYTKSEASPRFTGFYLGLGFGQILGGATSYGFQHVTGASLSGWRIMFVTLGAITVVVGSLILAFIPDTPMKAKWMTDAEKVALLKHVSVNQTGIDDRKFRPRQILDALADPQIYLMVLAVVLLSVSSGVVTSYSATLIRNLGYAPKQAALMNMPSGVVSIFFTLLVGYGIRKSSNRWAWIVGCICPAIMGGALMSFLPITNRNGILAGIYLTNAVVAPLAVFYAWTAANVAGATKRAFCVAIVSGSFSLGNIIGPQTFQARDAPEFRPAKLAVMGTQAGCALVTCCLVAYYAAMNKKRDAAPRDAEVEDSYLSPELWAQMTDKENKKFRYQY